MNINFKSIKNITEYMPSDLATLYITSSKDVADYLRTHNEAVCISLLSLDELSKFPDYKYFIMDGESNLGHLEKIYCHLMDLPFSIGSFDNFLIREEKADDLEAIYRLYSDSDSMRFLEPLPAIDSFDHKDRYKSVKDGYMLYEYGMWVIESTLSHEIIGRVGFEYVDESTVSIGYVIDRNERKKGYAKKACLSALKYLKNVCPELSVVAKCHKDNIASLKLLKDLNIPTQIF